ncbi:MAG: hypothetical protein ACOCR1_01405 [Planctomycetota bacterium]
MIYEGIATEATWGRWEDGEFVSYDSETPANAVKLRVSLNEAAPGGR